MRKIESFVECTAEALEAKHKANLQKIEKRAANLKQAGTWAFAFNQQGKRVSVFIPNK